MNLISRIQNKIVLSKIKDFYDIEGFLHPVEAIELHRIASKLPYSSVVVEIGSWKGKSTYCIAKGLKHGKVIAIDPFDASGEKGSDVLYEQEKGNKPLIDQFREKMSSLNVLDKIQILQGYSNDFVGKIPKIDFLFIDGDHSKEACEFDFTNYSPFVSSGGYIAFHDFYADRKDLGPTWVIENKVMPSKNYQFVGLANSLWVCKKL